MTGDHLVKKRKAHSKAQKERPGVAVAPERKKSVVVPGGAVVYVGRIPHGFFEEEMRAYFGQFGEITRLRLSRNRTTGASRHYAFIEFRHLAVAKIVAETMDGYLLFNHLLQVRVLPEEQVHQELFKGANRKFRVVPWAQLFREQYNARDASASASASASRGSEKRAHLKKKLAELGISYDLDSIVNQ